MYQIITDSACDLPASMLEQLKVSAVPLIVNFRGEARPDSVADAEVKTLYDAMRAGEVATTSAVNPDDWSRFIEPVLAAGQDALVLAFSSGLSTTYQSAVIAANDLMEQYPQRKVCVVDTRCAALGQGLLVWHVCKQRDAGLSLEELAAWTEEAQARTAHWFTVDDLVYLKRGGRVSAASAVLGAMLNIKPVLHVNEEGRLVSVVKARGRKAAIEALAKKYDESCDAASAEMVFICHADCLADAQKLEQLMRQRGAKEVFIGNLGAVIGSHAGPGTLALVYMGKHR